MYYPYFRGKQYELITIRESADTLAQSGFIPIIEPVKGDLGGLKKTLDVVVEKGGSVIVIVNPFHGDHSNDGEGISRLLSEEFSGKANVLAGILLKEDMAPRQVVSIKGQHRNHTLAFIHSGFSDAKALVAELGSEIDNLLNCFYEPRCGKLYMRNFKDSNRILIRDGFIRRNNREYPFSEHFSDLHVTFSDEGVNGFSDFLIVGDEYSETGGPAYAVAIHLTFIDAEKDDAMYIYHFKSLRQDTPQDPAGKFAEALKKMIEVLGPPEAPKSKVLETSAVEEFRELYKRGHFPGLGYVKKLSMKHHIETLAHYFKR